MRNLADDSLKEHAAVRFGPVLVTKPLGLDEPGVNERYMHLCSSRMPPVVFGLPSGSDFVQDPVDQGHKADYKSTNGNLFAHCYPHIDRTISGDRCVYGPHSRRQNGEPREQSLDKFHRLLRCAAIEEAIEEWDADALKTYINDLELEPVSFSNGDPLQPTLQVWQTIEYNGPGEGPYRPPTLRVILGAGKDWVVRKGRSSKKRLLKRSR